MAFRIQDGYTLTGKTSGKGADGEVIPVVSFEYRPPTAKQMSAWRFASRAANSGEEIHKINCEFIVARLVSWDVESGSGGACPVAEFIERIPDPIFLDILNEVTTWKPKPQGDAAGN